MCRCVSSITVNILLVIEYIQVCIFEMTGLSKMRNLVLICFVCGTISGHAPVLYNTGWCSNISPGIDTNGCRVSGDNNCNVLLSYLAGILPVCCGDIAKTTSRPDTTTSTPRVVKRRTISFTRPPTHQSINQDSIHCCLCLFSLCLASVAI